VREENLPAQAAAQGEYLLAKLKPFAEKYAAVGEVRGKGLMIALDLVQDKHSREPIDPMGGYANKVAEIARENGVLVRPVGTKIILSPPLVIGQAECDAIVSALAAGFEAA
jgi:4-aminobutyrate aminotransferase-like enzyme